MKEVRLTVPPLVLTLVIGFGLFILLQLVQRALWVLVLVVLAMILAAAMMPIVRALRSVQLPPGGWRLPKALAVVLIYLFLAIALAAMVYLVGAVLITEILALVTTLPETAETLVRRLREFEEGAGLPGLTPEPEEIAAQARGIATQVTGALEALVLFFGGIAEFIFRLFIVLTLALFLVVESSRILQFWVSLFPPSQRSQVRGLTVDIGNKVAFWLLGQIAVATTTGVLAGLGSALLGLPFPALIGLTTALLDLAPVLGTTLMVFPAFFLGLTQSLTMAIIAAAFFFALAQFDGNVLQPLITGRTVALSPTLIIIAVPLGLALLGAVGALIAIPIAAAIQVVTCEVILPWLHERQREAEEARERAQEADEERQERAA